jgi:dihydroorotate dehydrogenase (fumarate)
MNLKTSYMGFELKNPIIAGASPLSGSFDGVKSLEDHGAACVVMHSLFEEQINHESHALDHFLFEGSESYAEALSYFPEPESFDNLNAEHYLEEILRLKHTIDIPLIASLNGVSAGGWIRYAKKLQEAGADAIELNITYIPTDPSIDGRAVEEMYLQDVRSVREHTTLPISVKMNPYFSAPAHMAKAFERKGAKALVLFDRPVHADIDLENLNALHRVVLSTSDELSEGLRWSAILYKELNLSLCLSTGVHTHLDVLKAIMSGADAVQMASALLRHGASHIGNVLDELQEWMEKHEYESIAQMKGSLSLNHCPNKAAYERANYMQTLQEYRS